jgi:hypothetical protein
MSRSGAALAFLFNAKELQLSTGCGTSEEFSPFTPPAQSVSVAPISRALHNPMPNGGQYQKENAVPKRDRSLWLLEPEFSTSTFTPRQTTPSC